MVEEKAVAGKRALGAWFSQYTDVGAFRKLISSLVESTMLMVLRSGGAIQT